MVMPLDASAALSGAGAPRSGLLKPPSYASNPEGKTGLGSEDDTRALSLNGEGSSDDGCDG